MNDSYLLNSSNASRDFDAGNKHDFPYSSHSCRHTMPCQVLILWNLPEMASYCRGRGSCRLGDCYLVFRYSTEDLLSTGTLSAVGSERRMQISLNLVLSVAPDPRDARICRRAGRALRVLIVGIIGLQ